MDLIVDEVGEIVVNNVHAGAGAQAGRRGAEWKDRLHAIGVGKVNLGKLGYPIGALAAAVKPPFIRVRVEVDGEVIVDLDEPILMVAVGNGASVGGGTELTPDADPGDGRVDVMVSRATGPLARFGYGAKLVVGRHPERDDVTYLRGIDGLGLGRGVLVQRRRGDLRTRAAPLLAGRARGVLTGRAPVSPAPFLHLAGAGLELEAAFALAEELVECASGRRPDVVGRYVVPPADGAPTRPFQTLHVDFGLPLAPVRPRRRGDVHGAARAAGRAHRGRDDAAGPAA